MYDTPRTIDTLLAMLAAGPPRLAEFTAGLSPAQLTASPAPGEWALRDVLSHLRACGDVWGCYITLILNEDHPTYKAVNPTTWIRQTNYREIEFQPSLEAFADQRHELLAILKPLPAAAWERKATAITAGRPRERTVYTYAQWLANHELSHLNHIARWTEALRARPAGR
jgi:hypothetical protein